MTVQLMPNVEVLFSDFLRDQAEVTALVGAHVYTVLPAKFDAWPAVRVTRIPSAPVHAGRLHLDGALVQVDVWGGPKALAFQIIETIRAATHLRLEGGHDAGGCTGVDFGPMGYLPDESWTPARPRYTCDVTLYVHPSPTSA